MVTIRKETLEDVPSIRIVNERAFDQPTEADLVDTLQQTCPDAVSLVALSNDHVVGHILFTPVTIESKNKIITGMGLAPMAVLTAFQGQGIGSQMVRTGLAEMKKARIPFVIVLGHPEYYPRFGFVSASQYGIKSEYDTIPDEAFMILALHEEALQGVSGVARYRPEFGKAT